MKTILIEPIPVQVVVNHGALTITDETNRLLYFHVYDSKDDKHSSYDDKEAADAVCRFLNREHTTDGSPCWCEPETDYKDPETGVSVIVHKRPQ